MFRYLPKFINFHSFIHYKFQLSSFLVLLVDSKTERRCCSTRYYALPFFCWDIFLFHWLSFSPHYLGLNEFVQNLFEKLKNWLFSKSLSLQCCVPHFVLQLESFSRKKIGHLSSHLFIMILQMKYLFIYKGCSMLHLQHG